jgi:predicted nucleic acid-binding protein
VIVLDTSIMVPAFIDMPDSAGARKVMAPKGRWALPPLWRFEFTSAVVTLVRAGKIDQTDAHRAMDDARVAVIDREVPVDQGQVMRLAIRLNISAYDAQYIGLAEEFDAVCVTADKDLRAKAPTRTILLDEYLQ